MPRAAIDIGSNSLLLLVIDDDGTVLHDQATVVGLGRGLGDRGLFQPDRMEHAQDTLAEYVQAAVDLGVPASRIRAVATSAARRALNAETFFSRIKRTHGVSIDIISGDEEARLTWMGSLRDLPPCEQPLLVVDLGGGSTELALGDDAGVTRRTSVPVGSVRLTEQFLGEGPVERANLGRCRSWVDVSVQRFDFGEPRARTVVGVAGTVTTLATLAQGLDTYDSDRIHGTTLERSALQQTIERLMPMTQDERRAAVPSAPDRANYLIAGAAILDRVLAAAGAESLLVSDRGLRYGLAG